jgi:predicted acyltransferase
MDKHERLYSLDALRGFDMFFIIGGATLIKSLFNISSSPFSDFILGQMSHVKWHGFAFYDMIFPLFLFIAGVSFPYSLASSRNKGFSESKIIITVVKRGLKLVFFGLIFNAFLKFDFENMRYASVLGRIGIAWMLAALLYIRFDIKWIIVFSAIILIGYYLLNLLIVSPNTHPDSLPFSVESSIVGWFDVKYLPGKTYLETHDPEGILSTFPAIVTALLGMLTGRFLRDKSQVEQKKVIVMLIASFLLIVSGLVWDVFFPINKMLWTSSFVLFVGGLSLLLLTIFYYVIDVCKMKKWSFFFKVIGMNSITIYMAQRIVNFKQITDFFGGGIVKLFSETYQPLIFSIFYLVIIWSFLYFLYHHKIFLKV